MEPRAKWSSGAGRQGENSERSASPDPEGGSSWRSPGPGGRSGAGTHVLERPQPALAPVAAPPTRVLFVAGYGRSGSTLLDVLLDNAGPQVFGAGELRRVFDEYRAGARCSCGARYNDCPVWSGVFGRLEYERNGQPEWAALLEAITREIGARVIVDSSKTTVRTYEHLPRLARSGLDVRVIHLIRDPRGVMWSVRRGSNEALEAGRPPQLRGGMARGLIGWTMSNLIVEWLCRRLDLPVLRVRYEDLVRAPIEQVCRIGEFGGVDMVPCVHKLVEGSALSGGHGVRGNRLRRNGEIRLNGDSEWRKRLPVQGRLLGFLGWPLAHRYGYRLSAAG